MSKNPPETKVIAAGAGAPFGLAIAAYVNWQLGVSVFGASTDASKAADAVAAVPAPVSVLLGLLVTGLVAYLAGYAAPHTSRSVNNGTTARLALPEARDAGHADLATVLIATAVSIIVLTVWVQLIH